MLQPGILFDNRYELIRKIGRGGFAEVWLVKDTLTSLEEALKIYAPGEGLDEDGLKVFIQELTVVHDLRHTNLLTPKSLGQYQNQPYLILPYCPNGSLNKKVGKCTEDDAWNIIEQVASGLVYLHKQGVVHQDIKPDNILVDANQYYVITDFGISLKAQSTLRKSMREVNSGTMAYMAPERFSVEPHPIPANDIWSLGAMMFELIEGNVPFEEHGGGKQKSGADIPTMHADVSNNLKQVIRSMLALKAEERPLAAHLAELAKSKRTRPIPTDPDTNQGPQGDSLSQESNEGSSSTDKRGRIIGGIVVAIILLIVVGVVGIDHIKSKKAGSNENNPVDTVAAIDPKTYSPKVEQKSTATPEVKIPVVEKPTEAIEKEQRQKEEALKQAKEEAEKQAKEEAERRARAEAEKARAESLIGSFGQNDAQKGEAVAPSKSQGWVDLGLPSGTLWKDKNEGGGFYTYDEAVRKFGKNIPSKKQWEELKNKCKWTWNVNGYRVKGPSGEYIFLPAAGYRECYGGVSDVSDVNSDGLYWSSTPNGSANSWYLYFDLSEITVTDYDRCPGLSVRLVR